MLCLLEIAVHSSCLWWDTYWSFPLLFLFHFKTGIQESYFFYLVCMFIGNEIYYITNLMLATYINSMFLELRKTTVLQVPDWKHVCFKTHSHLYKNIHRKTSVAASEMQALFFIFFYCRLTLSRSVPWLLSFFKILHNNVLETSFGK